MEDSKLINKLEKENALLRKQLDYNEDFHTNPFIIFNSNKFLGDVYHWSYDVEGQTISGVNFLCELVGLPVGETIKLNDFISIIEHNFLKDLLDIYIDFSSENNGKIYENTFDLPNGIQKKFRHSSWLFEENGKRKRIIGVVKDISINADDGNTQLLNYLPKVFSQSEESYLIYSNKTKEPIFVSPNFFSLFNIAPDKLKGLLSFFFRHVVSSDNGKFEKFRNNAIKGLEDEEIVKFDIQSKIIWIKLKSVTLPGKDAIAIIIKNVTNEQTNRDLLDESENKYQTLIHQLPFILLIHKDGIIKFANEQAKIITGTKRYRDLVGRNILELIPQRFHKRNLQRMQQVTMNEDVVFPVEEVVINSKGIEVPVKLYSENILFNGEICHQLILQDLTQEKKFLDTIEREQVRFQQLLDIAPITTIILDRTGKITLINIKGAATLGLRAEEIIGKQWFDNFIPLESRQKVQDTFLKLISGEIKNAEVYENAILKANGKQIIIEWHNILLKDSKGKITGILSSGQDVTFKKEYEQRIKQQRSLLRLIIDKIPSLLAYVSNKYEFLYINKAYADFYQQDFSSFINKKASDILPKDYWENIKPKIDTVLTGNTVEFENERVNFNGEKIITITKYIPHFNEDGKVNAFLASIEDVTEKRKTENELQEREENLRLLINNTPDIICFKDAKGRWLLANDANLKLFNLEQVDYFGKTDFKLASYTSPIYKDYFDNSSASDEKAWKAKKLTRVTEIIPYGNNELIFDIIKIPVFNKNGSRRGLIVMGRDVSENWKAAKDLQESEDKFRRIFTESLTPQLLISSDLKFIDCNDAAFKLLKYNSKSDIIGKSSFDISPEFQENGMLSKKAAQEYVKKAIETGSIGFDWIHLTKTKQNVYLSISLTLLIINGENVLHVVWSDISKRVERERENRKLTTTIEQSPITVVITDLDAKIEYVNPFFTKITGYKPEEVIDKNPRILQSGLTPFHTYVKMWDKLTKGETWFGEFTNKTKSGKVYVESCTILPIKDKDGKITNYVALKEDVTKKHEAEAQLTESENRFKSLFYENESILLLFDPSNGNIIEANDAACNFYGYSLPEMLKMSMFEFNTLKNDKLLKLLEKVRDGKKNHFIFQHKLKNGKIKDVELYTGLLNSKGKEVFYSIIHDISDSVKTKQELVKAKEKAEESDRLKSAFLANMSHEIRTPMNAILGFGALLQDNEISNEERDEFVEIINTSGNSLLEIINDIIEMSKIEAGQISINKKEAVVDQIVSTVFNQQSISANKKNIELRFVPDNIYRHITAMLDETKIKQILSNLVNNAIKFTDEGYVEMGYRIMEKEIEFYVQDTGIGISEENHHLVFDRFNKITWDTDGKTIYPGTGLGLSISKAFVEKMGGEIFFESEKGKGTSFHFVMPLEVVHNPLDLEKPAEYEGKIDLTNRTILVAEDVLRNYKFLEILFTKMGAKVLHAFNGKEAVDITRENHNLIDLILMDIKMPNMNGYEATKIIKKEYPSIPVIAQTAYAFYEDKGKAIDAGCDGYISKPIKINKLTSILKDYF